MSRSGSRSVGRPGVTPSIRSVIRYWCWTGQSGTRTPASRPSTFDQRPAHKATVSQTISPWSVTTPVTRPSPVRKPVTAQSSTIRTPPWRAPLASAWAMSEGLAWPSVGSQAAPTRSDVSISGQRSFASAGDRRCISRPKLRAVVAWRLISIIRSALQASLRPPFIFQPLAWPVSASRRSYSSTECVSSRVMLALVRSWPTRPAACQVEPEVRRLRSSSTTSRQPSLARW